MTEEQNNFYSNGLSFHIWEQQQAQGFSASVESLQHLAQEDDTDKSFPQTRVYISLCLIYKNGQIKSKGFYWFHNTKRPSFDPLTELHGIFYKCRSHFSRGLIGQ